MCLHSVLLFINKSHIGEPCFGKVLYNFSLRKIYLKLDLFILNKKLAKNAFHPFKPQNLTNNPNLLYNLFKKAYLLVLLSEALIVEILHIPRGKKIHYLTVIV